MFRRQSSKNAKVFDGVTLRNKAIILSKPASPLLINVNCEPKATCSNSERETIEIKDLCQSPRASRCSMFNFSPTFINHSPEDSPSPSHKELSDDSSVSPDSEGTYTANNHKNSPPFAERKRYMVVNELIATEMKYIDNLNTILSTFMPALEQAVPPRCLRLLIPAQLEQLVECHQEILAHLQRHMSSDVDDYSFVGDIFSELCSRTNTEFCNMYHVYMGEFKIAMKTLAMFESDSSQFNDILSVLQQNPICERLSLASYLLTPVQRLPRYELLLKELLKHTTTDHPDSYYIREALVRLHRELTKLNQSIKSCQMASSANGRTPRLGAGNRSTHNMGRRTSRRAKRTLSMLKKFVSVTNIDDYSSGDSEDLLKDPRMLQRRNALVCNSMVGSEMDLVTCTLGNDSVRTFRNTKLSGSSRAVSCSDLMMEFTDRKQQSFWLPSATDTMEEEEEEDLERLGTSLSYSSNSSLSSLDSRRHAHESLITAQESPTRIPLAGDPIFSVPATTRGEGGVVEAILFPNVTEHTCPKYDAAGSNEVPLDISTDELLDCGKRRSWKKPLEVLRKNMSLGRVSDMNSSNLKYLKDQAM